MRLSTPLGGLWTSYWMGRSELQTPDEFLGAVAEGGWTLRRNILDGFAAAVWFRGKTKRHLVQELPCFWLLLTVRGTREQLGRVWAQLRSEGCTLGSEQLLSEPGFESPHRVPAEQSSPPGTERCWKQHPGGFRAAWEVPGCFPRAPLVSLSMLCRAQFDGEVKQLDFSALFDTVKLEMSQSDASIRANRSPARVRHGSVFWRWIQVFGGTVQPEIQPNPGQILGHELCVFWLALS